MFITKTNDLEARRARSLDEVTILSNDEIMRMSNEEFERFMLKYEKPAPSGPPRPPIVDPYYYEPDPPPGPPAVIPVGLYYEPDHPPISHTIAPNVAPDALPKRPVAARKKKKPMPAIPQEEEMGRFFKAIDSTRDRAIFRLMYHAGLRASEIGLVEMRDYQPRTDRLMVNRLKGSNSGEHHQIGRAHV